MFKRIQDWLNEANAALDRDAIPPSTPDLRGTVLIGKVPAGAGVGPTDPEPDQRVWRDTVQQDPDQTRSQGALPGALGAFDSNVQGRFLPVRELGRGGMSSVHESADMRLVRHTALKVMHATLAGDPAMCKQFIIEAQITAQLEHPNIIPIYEFGQDRSGVPYINMRKVSGETLRAFMHADPGQRLHPDNVKAVVRILLKVCDALAYAHSRGVIHRDLKPANIMVGEFGEVYVMDWGIALTGVEPLGADPVRIDPELLGETGSGPHSAGTPAYMAPEQTASSRWPVDRRTDVFLLGAVLYELLVGQPPYRGASTLEEATRLAECGAYPAIESGLPGQRPPPRLVRVVERAMATDPADRFPDMLALKQALEAFLEGSPDLDVVRYAPGETIVREGEPGECAFVIAAGHCEVYSIEHGARQVLRRLGPGDVFGEMAILSGGLRISSVDAMTEVELEVVTREALTDGLGVNTWVGKFVTALADRFVDVDRRARDADR